MVMGHDYFMRPARRRRAKVNRNLADAHTLQSASRRPPSSHRLTWHMIFMFTWALEPKEW